MDTTMTTLICSVAVAVTLMAGASAALAEAQRRVVQNPCGMKPAEPPRNPCQLKPAPSGHNPCGTPNPSAGPKVEDTKGQAAVKRPGDAMKPSEPKNPCTPRK
jgi:hypothetical protein